MRRLDRSERNLAPLIGFGAGLVLTFMGLAAFLSVGFANAWPYVLLALAVALAMKVVGILLVTSLIIIPAALARGFARTPEQMAVFAVLAGWLSVGAGIWGSFTFDTPTGPTIVVAACVLFALSGIFRMRR